MRVDLEPQELAVGKAVRVLWEDSHRTSGWLFEEEIEAKVVRVSSLGYVVASSQEALTISTSINSASGRLDPLSIPWPCVRAVHELGAHLDVN